MLIAAGILDDGTDEVTFADVTLATVSTSLQRSLRIMTDETAATATYVCKHCSEVSTSVEHCRSICCTYQTTHTFVVICLFVRHVLSTVFDKTVVHTLEECSVDDGSADTAATSCRTSKVSVIYTGCQVCLARL